MHLFGSPEEAIAHQQLTHQSRAHEINDFLQSLSKEQLDTLRMLVISMADPDSGHILAAQHHGMIVQIMALKHAVCVCGVEHESAESLLAPTAVPATDVDQLDTWEGRRINPDHPSGAALMAEYRLEARPGFNVLFCTGCGMQYSSLRDRMIKDPDDCHGCHLKSAQG